MVNLFDMAINQLGEAVELLVFDSATRELLRWPRREFHFTFPVLMDDGSYEVLHGFRIQYNDARGPTYGSIRFRPDETPEKARGRAAWVTWKTALINLPLGGAYGGVTCDPEKLSERELERLARGYVRALSFFVSAERDIIAPDVDAPLEIAEWMSDERSVIQNGAFPFPDRKPTDGFSGALMSNSGYAKSGIFCVREAAKYLNVELKDACTIIYGFNAVGSNAAKLSTEHFGSNVIGISDSREAVFNPSGLDIGELTDYKRRTGSINDFPGAENVKPQETLGYECDVLWITDGEAVITAENADRIKARIIAESADGTTTPEADRMLHNNGVFVIPDIICNTGGVVASYFERAEKLSGDYRRLETTDMLLDERITKTFHNALEERNARNVHMRLAAYLLAVERVANAMKIRGWC